MWPDSVQIGAEESGHTGVVSVEHCYSWDIGAAHFIIFSTEVYFFLEDGISLAEYQYRWLEEDLKVRTSNHCKECNL